MEEGQITKKIRKGSIWEREKEREWEWVCISICTGIDEKTTREVKKLNNSKMFMEEGQITKRLERILYERERERERERDWKWVCISICTGIGEITTCEVKKLNNSKIFMEEGQITKKIRKGSIWEREREREREWEWVCISICTGIDEKTTREVKKQNNSKMFMEEGQITKKIRKGSIWEREREKVEVSMY